jgi:hypothetical protein
MWRARAAGASVWAKYLVGCDGGRSLIRKQAGIDFPGWDAYLIAEVEMTAEPAWGVRHGEKGANALGKAEDGKRVGVVLVEPCIGKAPSRPLAWRYLEATRSARLLFLEQPLAAADLAGLAALARVSPIPIGADEGIHALRDIEAHAQHCTGGVSLKLIKLGGFSAALEAAALCERLRLEINVAAKVAESSIASAAAIHLACALPRIAWGVSLTHVYLAEDLVRTPQSLRDGRLALPDAPGLGVDVDERQIARLRVA